MAQQTVELNNASVKDKVENGSKLLMQNAAGNIELLDGSSSYSFKGDAMDLNASGRGEFLCGDNTKNRAPVGPYARAIQIGAGWNILQLYGGSYYDGLAFRGFGTDAWTPWRKVWHDGNLANPGSSQKFKLNIQAYKDDALGMINRMQVKQFDYKTKLDGWATPNAGNVGVVGFIMEDETTPEVIKVKRIEGEEYDQEGKVIKQGELVEHPDYYNAQTLQGLLIKAVQQLTAKVEELEAKLAEK